MDTRLLTETLLLDEKAVRGTGQLGKVGRELLCCLISAGNRNAGILTIKGLYHFPCQSIYIFQELKAFPFLKDLLSWRSYFTSRKHQHCFQSRLASALSMDCRHKLSSFTARFYSCESTSHMSGHLPQPRWLR